MNPAMIRKIQKMQKDMEAAQKELEMKTFTGTSGGVVTVEAFGSKEVSRITINKDAIEGKEDLDLLEDVLLAAINDVMKKIDDETARVMGQFQVPGGFGF